MLSLAPATTTAGLLASMATAGSFCLFCENGLGGLPKLTRASCAAPRPASAAARRGAADAHAVVLRSRRARERGDEQGGGERAQRRPEQPVIDHGYPFR